MIVPGGAVATAFLPRGTGINGKMGGDGGKEVRPRPAHERGLTCEGMNNCAPAGSEKKGGIQGESLWDGEGGRAPNLAKQGRVG